MNEEIKEILARLSRYVITPDVRHDFDDLLNYITNLQQRIDKAIEIIEKYGKEKQFEEDYLMNRVNIANYNCLLLDILQGSDKE